MTKISNLYSLTNYVTADSSGSVGIGIAPQSSIASMLSLEISNTGMVYAGNGQMAITNNGYYASSWKYKTTNYATNYTTDSGSHVFYTAPSGTANATVTFTERLRISNTGNLGIGASSPKERLEIAGYNGQNLRVYGRDGISYNSLSSNLYYNGSAWVRDNASYGASEIGFGPQSEYIFFTTTSSTTGSPSERMRIAPGGNVGIGTTSVDAPLTVYGNIYAGYGGPASNRGIYFGNSGYQASILYNNSNGNLDIAPRSGYNTMFTSGGVYINRSSTIAGYGLVLGSDDQNLQTMGLFVKNNGNNTINFFNGSGSYVASISINASTVTYGTGSDYRLKEDYKDFDGLEKVSAIKVYDFKFKSEGDRMEGVIAHELQEVIPYAVNGEKDEVNEDGSPKIQNVDYSKLVPILIKSIQELSAKVTALENK